MCCTAWPIRGSATRDRAMTARAGTLLPATVAQRGRRLAAHRFLRNRPAVIAAVVLFILVLTALLADQIGPINPIAIDLDAARKGPSAAHLLGADNLGRDVWSRLVHGTSVSLTVGIFSVAINLVIGVAVGAV